MHEKEKSGKILSLLPVPTSCQIKDGSYRLPLFPCLTLDPKGDALSYRHAQHLKQQMQEILGATVSIQKSLARKGDIVLALTSSDETVAGEEGYQLTISDEGVLLLFSHSHGLWNGMQTLLQILKQGHYELPHLEIIDAPALAYRGFYHDVTRGKIPTLATLFDLVDRMAHYKLNQLQLYVEHTFAYVGQEEIWAGEQPFTPDDLLALDAYCAERHVELVPSFAVFGHLYELLRSRKFSHLCELGPDQSSFSLIDRMQHHTIAVALEESLTLAAQMIEQVAPLFSSKFFNLCGDETFDLGEGQSKELAEQIGKGSLYTTFLLDLMKEVSRHGKTPMFWGDIIAKYPEQLEQLPADVICLTWWYGMEIPTAQIQTVAESGVTQIVCPGVGGWNRLSYSHASALVNMRGMIEAGLAAGACGVLNTDWGDFGHINSLSQAIPGMIYGAALSWHLDPSLSDQTLCESISLLEYGDDSKTLVSLLYDIGCCELFEWRYLIAYLDYHDNHHRNEAIYREVAEQVGKITFSQWEQASLKAAAGYRQLCDLLPCVDQTRRGELVDMMLAAEGIQLLNAVSAWLSNSYELMPLPVLSEKLMLWFDAFAARWRTVARESELFRIRQAIWQLLWYLDGGKEAAVDKT